MLNKFQIDILSYLENTSEHFLSYLTDKNEQGFIIIDNIIPELISYLGSMIRRDLYLHESNSKDFKQLEDMLIEIHIKPNKEFTNALSRTALKSIKNKKI